MNNPKETEILDLLEKILTESTQKLMRQVGTEITLAEASNLLSKIGSRIMFRESVGKERIDEIILNKKLV